MPLDQRGHVGERGRTSDYRQILALVGIAALNVLVGCATSNLEMAWVRTDGRNILDDPALLQQGKTCSNRISNIAARLAPT